MIDEASFYDRALSPSELAAIYNAGTAGKLKGKTTPTGSGVQTPLSDATVTFANVSAAGTTSESGIDLGLLPRLPSAVTFTGLAYDISTTATYQSGSPDDVRVCFNLPSLSGAIVGTVRVMHLEGNLWVDRTADTGNTLSNICTDNLRSLSPFVIVRAAAPTVAAVNISGRATIGKRGIRGALVTLTQADGSTRTVSTGVSGQYRFTEIAAGQNVILTIGAKRYVFVPNTQVINVTENLEEVNFEALGGF